MAKRTRDCATHVQTLGPLALDRAVARHREAAEEALARIRHDPQLTDREKGRQVSQLIAEANARTLALCAEARFTDSIAGHGR